MAGLGHFCDPLAAMRCVAHARDNFSQVVAGLCIAAGLLLNLAGYSCFYFTLALAGFLTGLALLFGVTCGLSHSLLGLSLIHI